MSQPDAKLSQDVVFDLLSSARRRYVLSYLQQDGGTVDFGTLAKHVAAWENDTAVEELTNQEQKRVYVSLYQTHIPKLEDAGIVNYDQERGTVTLTEDAVALEPYLQEGTPSDGWYRYYVGLAALGGVLYLAVVLDAPAIGAVQQSLVCSGIILAFLVTGVANYVYERRSNGFSFDLLEQQ